MTSSAATVCVALGDSISIDDYAGGPGCGGASLLFANREDDFPEWRAWGASGVREAFWNAAESGDGR